MQQAIGVIGPTDTQTLKQISDETPHVLELLKEAIAAHAAGDEPRVAELQSQIDQINFKWCKLTKQTLDTNYAQHFKIWKQFSDAARASSRDLYAYSQPIIDQIWVPSLNELVQANRELAVLALYKEDAGYAAGLASLAKAYNDLKCIEPVPPKPPKTVKDPTLTRKEPDCPLKPPLNLNFVVAKMELGCDRVKISGGEILRVEVERQFGKSTTVWVGVGVTGSLPGLGASDESLGVSENGKSWSPPGVSVGASATAQTLVGFRIGPDGQLDDVMVKSTVQAGGNIGPVSGALGVTGTISLENGPSITPVSKLSYGK